MAESGRLTVGRFSKPITSPLQHSNALSSLPCSVVDTIIDYTALSVASDVCSRCCLGLIVLVREVEVEIECRVHVCPNVVPVLVLSNLYLSVASLLASCPSPTSCGRTMLC